MISKKSMKRTVQKLVKKNTEVLLLHEFDNSNTLRIIS